jgi:hypothetical protein
MLRKDAIYWWAAGISVLAVVLFAVTQSQFWLALMIASYLLRPTLASLGVGRRTTDERLLTIHYRSGTVAFAVTIFVCVYFAARLGAEGNHDFELFAMTIVIGLVTKALFSVIVAHTRSEAASKILIWTGLMVGLFSSFSSFDSGSVVGILISATPGLSIAGVGLLSRVYPRPAGVVILVATAALLWKILGKGLGWGQIGTAAIVGVPLILAALCLITRKRVDEDVETESAV